MMKRQVSVTVLPEMSPRIENWLMNRDVDYEVEVVRTFFGVRLKIIAEFPFNEDGKHRAEVYKRFLERLTGKGGV